MLVRHVRLPSDAFNFLVVEVAFFEGLEVDGLLGIEKDVVIFDPLRTLIHDFYILSKLYYSLG